MLNDVVNDVVEIKSDRAQSRNAPLDRDTLQSRSNKVLACLQRSMVNNLVHTYNK